MKYDILFFRWLPRFICIASILFVSVFALDAFEPGMSLRFQLIAFFIHLLPSFILLGALIIAWRRELTGGILFLLTGVAGSVFIYTHNRNVNHFTVSESLQVILIIALPFIIAGVLFTIGYFLHGPRQHHTSIR